VLYFGLIVMMGFLTALHDSAFSTWVREAETVWAFPTVLTIHTFGMMLLVGAAWVMDLRLLGIARAIPIGPLRPLFRIMWAAFWVNLVTGIILFIADPERKATSLLFGFKMVLVAVNIVLMSRLERAVYRDSPEPVRVGIHARQLAVASAVLWAGTIFAGRLLAYM
jgi:hypothetical protein